MRAVIVALVLLTAWTTVAIATPGADACPQNEDGYPHCGGPTCVAPGVCIPCIGPCPE